MHKIEYLPIAQQDLMEALDYLILTLDAPQAAAELLDELEDTVSRIARFRMPMSCTGRTALCGMKSARYQ